MSAEAVRARIEELLLDRALVGLSPREELELERLALRSGVELDPGFDIAAAALDVALTREAEAVPAALRTRLDELAREYVPAPPAAVAHPLRVLPRPAPRTPVLPWLVAAAALALAVLAWRGSGATAAPAELRAEVAAREDALRLDWTATEEAPGASGDVVWSNEAQAGVLRIRGLAANDPAREQYQLWIFDESQEHPIDGGVFDVEPGSETLVPIQAKLHVDRPTLFAVTREKPGGVVVSDRQRIVLVAQG